MNTIVFFNSLCKSINCFCISLLINGSNAENASSINIISVFVASALARPTLCCIPPDN